MTSTTATEPRTASRILDTAETLVQVNGYNGFSYADIAAELSLTKAALHYHFGSKAELGRALIDRYAERFLAALARIEGQTPDAPERLRAYSDLYAAVLRERRMCLCGMLAAEYQTLPVSMREAIVDYFDANEAWLTQVLRDGANEGTISLPGSPECAARMLIDALEGAVLIARPYDDIARFDATAGQLLGGLIRSDFT